MNNTFLVNNIINQFENKFKQPQTRYQFELLNEQLDRELSLYVLLNQLTQSEVCYINDKLLGL